MDGTQWTQEESQIQRSLQLLRGFRPHPTSVPQGMPERNVEAFGAHHNHHPFGRQENRDARSNRDGDELPEDNKSIKELTEVFKPLHLSEYLKQQAQLSKQFEIQLKKTYECLSLEKKNNGDQKAPKEISLFQPIRSELNGSSPQQVSRYTFLEQQRQHVE